MPTTIGAQALRAPAGVRTPSGSLSVLRGAAMAAARAVLCALLLVLLALVHAQPMPQGSASLPIPRLRWQTPCVFSSDPSVEPLPRCLCNFLVRSIFPLVSPVSRNLPSITSTILRTLLACAYPPLRRSDEHYVFARQGVGTCRHYEFPPRSCICPAASASASSVVFAVP